MIFDCSKLTTAETQYYLQHIVAPRPIAFASTINKKGEINLSPFSFFNLFSSHPPIVIFSPARRVRDNTTKHTLQNVLEVPEVVINMVSYDMVQQTSLASCEYAAGVNEFEKAGFTMQLATRVQPPMVKESKAKLECKVIEVKPLGTGGGAGNLVICEVLIFHIDDAIINADKKINQASLQHVARLGGDWYCKVEESNLFIVPKPNTQLGIGIDALPEHIRNSGILTGNDLGMLANVDAVPQKQESPSNPELASFLSVERSLQERHLYASALLKQNKITEAWQVLV